MLIFRPNVPNQSDSDGNQTVLPQSITANDRKETVIHSESEKLPNATIDVANSEQEKDGGESNIDSNC